MDISSLVVFNYDPETAIAELSSRETIRVETPEMLNMMCSYVNNLLDGLPGTGPYYLAVDVSKIAIDPGLTDKYQEKIIKIGEKFLYPNGLARYGYEITRVTIQLMNHKLGYQFGRLFYSRKDAMAYLECLSAECQHAPVENLKADK